MVDAAPLRIVFFGTPAFAVPTLERPARLASRGRRRRHAAGSAARTWTEDDASPVKEAATRRRHAVLQPESVKTADFAAELAALNADLAVVAAYGQILTERC